MKECKLIPWPPTFWTDTMIEDATFIPCGPLLEGDDIGERIIRTRRWFAALLGTDWLDE